MTTDANPHSSHPAKLARPDGPVVLLILDGVGIGRGDAFDAVARANTPQLDLIKARGLMRSLKAHGPAVGLPSESDIGNSEVGHNILGAGRIFDQGAKCVEQAFDSRSIWDGVWSELSSQVRNGESTLHFVGLLSDGNVHSNISHLRKLVERASYDGVKRVRVHVLFDGRDVPDQTAENYAQQLSEILEAASSDPGYDYQIASGGGRMTTTMDRYEADWGIVERGWQAHVLGAARPFGSVSEALRTFRDEEPGISDQVLPAFSICDADGAPIGTIEDGDAVLLFNFRGDRAIEISQAFESGSDFAGFDRVRVPDVMFAGMMLYDGDLMVPSRYLVQPEKVDGTLSEYLCSRGVSQFACAETQKYGHVTYFWNGNRASRFDTTLEEYLEIPSDRLSFDQRPWMKSAETADAVIEQIKAGSYRFIRANFAGGDMVGHTGNLAATMVAVEAIDLGLGRILKAIRNANGCLIVTADHGNADDMVQRDRDGEPVFNEGGKAVARTSHSLNEVPFMILEESSRSYVLRDDLNDAGLANVASTVIELLGLTPPVDYEPSLIQSGGAAPDRVP